MTSLLEQYRIADFLTWHHDRLLVLNPDFQRGSVWTPAARSYLIDTILRQLPVPKVFLRTNVDVASKKTVREVVDGQQRLRAIIDFSEDRFALSKRAGDLQGLKYSSMGVELQEIFLSYPIAVDQLLNADNNDVLEVFARLNSYSVPLNSPEKRHARFNGEFKWAVRNAARRWALLWDKYGVLSVRERVRMMDDSLTAEMLGILIDGVKDGGQPKIDAIYKRFDISFNPEDPSIAQLDSTLDYFLREFSSQLVGTPILRPPHFLMLFAAMAHALAGIPEGEMGAEMPQRDPDALSDTSVAMGNLLTLSSIIDQPLAPLGLEGFWRASLSSTQRISSRRVRFPLYYRALLPSAL